LGFDTANLSALAAEHYPPLDNYAAQGKLLENFVADI